MFWGDKYKWGWLWNERGCHVNLRLYIPRPLEPSVRPLVDNLFLSKHLAWILTCGLTDLVECLVYLCTGWPVTYRERLPGGSITHTTYSPQCKYSGKQQCLMQRAQLADRASLHHRLIIDQELRVWFIYAGQFIKRKSDRVIWVWWSRASWGWI